MKVERRTFLVWAGVALTVLLVDYALFWGVWGGWVNYDTEVQWNQVQSGVYTQWHPFVQTFLMMKLPSLVWNDYRVTVLWQVVLCALAFGHVMTALATTIMSRRWQIAAGCFVLLHPQFLFFMMSPVKDSAFAIAVLLVLAELVHVAVSRGRALLSWGVCVRLAAGLALAMSFRHNGLFFVVPILVLLLLLFGKVNRTGLCRLAGAFTVSLIVLKVLLPMGSVVHPASAHLRQYFFIESAGLPLSIMGAVYVKDPARMPAEARRVLESIRPREVWTQFYELGSFNVVKHHGVAKLPEETIAGIWFPGWMKFFRLFGQTVALDPKLALKAALRTTSLVWNPQTTERSRLTYPLHKIGVKGNLLFWQTTLILISIPVLGVCACAMWLMLLTCLHAVWSRRWLVLLLASPLLAYDLATMLFLTWYNAHRFFFMNVFVVVPAIWYTVHVMCEREARRR